MEAVLAGAAALAARVNAPGAVRAEYMVLGAGTGTAMALEGRETRETITGDLSLACTRIGDEDRLLRTVQVEILMELLRVDMSGDRWPREAAVDTVEELLGVGALEMFRRASVGVREPRGLVGGVGEGETLRASTGANTAGGDLVLAKSRVCGQ